MFRPPVHRSPSRRFRSCARWVVPALVAGALLVPTVGYAQTEETSSSVTPPSPPPSEATTLATTVAPPTPAPTAAPTAPPVVTIPVVTTVPSVPPTATLAPVSVVPNAEPPIITLAPETSSTSTIVGETTTSTSTTTTVDPNTTTTTIPIPVGLGEGVDEFVTPDDQPPAFRPVLPPSALIAPRNISLEKALAKLSEQQKRIVDEAQKQSDAATKRIADAQHALDELAIREDEHRATRTKLADEKEATAIKVRARALQIYAGRGVADLDLLLQSPNSDEFARNLDVIGAAQKRDADLIAKFIEAEKALDANEKELRALTEAKRTELENLLVEQTVLAESLATLQDQLSFVLSGQAIALGGFVFPVGAPFNFADTFGAPRMTGTKYQHTHQGTDIFAPMGTPLYATTRGVIARKAVAVLGGNKLWLVGADGTQYYYAHLSAYAEGIEDGVVVEAGQVIGYVGNTGNALTTPPHCHFEIHPGGGGAVDPFPILDAVRKSDATRLLAASKVLAVTTTTAPPTPGSGNAGIGVVSQEFAIGPVDASAAGARPSTTLAPLKDQISVPSSIVPA